ncbi:tbc1 domain family member 10a-like [Lichtheimia corymbifera JMRC:FSU:9682]|uniref:Tbc1 domain family member 10a-like n=1 Tax=Lichtheimia corymbifera JMRC:FSU:9682 TaxID=1263082 RepID=A0A068RTA3_9FUNG|nr:tbc1 domain family member 10a-like [Lichtheimia corymbifera JMRC:FSU:9682]
MDVKMTRHTSTDLEQINDKIKRLLRDPGDAFDQASVDVDSMTVPELKAFAEQGGLGACVSKADVLAETGEDLMYLSGERIVVLKHVQNDMYLGYCEGVIGKFNAENVHFVELDPRVLESLDAELDFIDGESYRLSSHARDSLQSYTSTSEQYSSSIHEHHSLKNGQWPIAARSSIESLVTTSSTPSMPNIRHRMEDSDFYGKPMLPTKPPMVQTFDGTENFDTSAFNDDYSAESDDDIPPPPVPSAQQTIAPTPTRTGSTMFKSTATRGSRPAPTNDSRITTKDEDDAMHDGDDEDETHGSKRETKAAPSSDIPVDEYGFIIHPDRSKLGSGSALQRADSSVKSMKEYREQEIKWINTVGKMDAGTVKKDAKFKKLVRSGIPASVRARVWQFLADSQRYAKKGTYENLCRKPRTKIYDVIDRDIARCYPDHSQFRDENSQGQRDLREILRAYSHYNTELEYCQGMGRLAGCMLMHMPAEEAFWLLVATIDRFMNGYFTPTLSQVRIDAYIIGELLKDHQPKLAHHLESNEVQPIMYIAQWFMTAFTMTLPWNSVLRVWDVFYFEGVKVFYRISLAILEIVKDHILTSCPTNSEILSFLLHIPHNYLTPDTLLDVAFRIKLSKTDIKRHAKKASSSTTDAMGLPVEHGLKNLMAGSPSTAGSLGGSFKGLGGKIIKKNSTLNMNKEYDS